MFVAGRAKESNRFTIQQLLATPVIAFPSRYTGCSTAMTVQEILEAGPVSWTYC